jgi:hypothetical protein
MGTTRGKGALCVVLVLLLLLLSWGLTAFLCERRGGGGQAAAITTWGTAATMGTSDGMVARAEPGPELLSMMLATTAGLWLREEGCTGERIGLPTPGPTGDVWGEGVRMPATVLRGPVGPLRGDDDEDARRGPRPMIVAVTGT